MRPGGSLARIGGDEFAMLLSESAPGDGASFEQLYEVADTALYARKFARAGTTV